MAKTKTATKAAKTTKPKLSSEDKEKIRQMLRALTPPRQTWHVLSSDGHTTYTVVWHGDGHLSCPCKGWPFLRETARHCRHTDEVLSELRRVKRVTIEQRDGLQFMTVTG